MDKLERILEIVRTWQHGFHWRALQHALEDGKRDDLPDEQRTLDYLLFRSWSKQSNEVREYLRENAPKLLKLMPPVDWGNDLLRYDPDGLTREMVEMEGELLAMRADPAKPTATEGAKLNGADKTRRKVRRPDSFTDADDKIISALLEHHEYDSPKDGGFSSVLNTEPATYDQLCDKSGVKSKDTIYRFFGKWFTEGGNDAYKRACKGGAQKLGLEIARLIPGDVPTFDRRLYIDREA